MEALFDYTLLGTVREGEKVRLYDAIRSGEPQRHYLVSEVALEPGTRELLRESMDCLRSGGCGKLAAVYARHGWCYLVFRAPGGVPLRAAVDSGLGKALASQRFALLRAIVLELYAARKLPYQVLSGSAAPEQIRVGRGGHPQLCFCVIQAALEVPREEAQRALCRAVAEVFRLLFPRELESAENSALRILVGKCEAGLYPSLPALADALGHVEDECEPPDWDSWAAKIWKCFARCLRPVGKLAVPLAGLAILCAVLLLPRGGVGPGPTEPYLIGDVVYVADPMVPGVAALSQERPPEETDEEKEAPAVTDDPERFSDHVVRSGETLHSVCAGYYGDAAYAPAVAAYNGLMAEEPLNAGTILKLPEPIKVLEQEK